MKKQLTACSILIIFILLGFISVYAEKKDEPRMDIVQLQEEIVKWDDAYLATYTKNESVSLSIREKLVYPKKARDVSAAWTQLALFGPNTYFPEYDFRWCRIDR